MKISFWNKSPGGSKVECSVTLIYFDTLEKSMSSMNSVELCVCGDILLPNQKNANRFWANRTDPRTHNVCYWVNLPYAMGSLIALIWRQGKRHIKRGIFLTLVRLPNSFRRPKSFPPLRILSSPPAMSHWILVQFPQHLIQNTCLLTLLT